MMGPLTGCATPTPHVGNPVTISAAEYRRVYDATLWVLRRHGFVLDRQDYRFGVVATRPLHAPTVLEPWLGRNLSFTDAVASTLNDQRRIATVRLEPAGTDRPASEGPQPPDYRLSVEVMMERRQIPRRYLTGSTAGRRVLRDLVATPVQWQRRGIKGFYWHPVGQDHRLEQRLLQHIIRKSMALEQAGAQES